MRRLLVVLALLAAACGPDADFRHARRLEDQGRVLEAVKAYEAFLTRHPGDGRSQEASYRAGSLYAVSMRRCAEARHDLEAAARLEGPFTEPAKQALMACPDYFPMRDGAAWTYVDTLSGGKNMRLVVKASSDVVSGAFYAGEKRFRDYRRRYRSEDWTVWEEEDGLKAPILRWPYAVGRTWTADKTEGVVTYTIEKDDASVDVKAGRFTGCLKVRSQVTGYPSWVYDYYCPGVGRVKTTVGVPGAENPNTELATTTLKAG